MSKGLSEAALENVDVIVLGAGPAGLAAAITARQNRLETLVLESRQESAVRPGESLHPGLEALFKQLGIAEAIDSLKLHRNRGHRVEDGATAQFVPYGEDEHGPWQGFQVRRENLNKTLSKRAEQLGARIVYHHSPDALMVESGEVRGIRSGMEEIHAPVIIDATGSRRWLARQLGLDTLYGSPRLFASYSYEPRPQAPDDPIFTYRPQGWSWRANIGGGQVAVVDLDLSGVQMPQRPSRGADVTWEKVPACAGPGYFLVGDAAGKLDPASGNGILRAFMTAILAASAAATIIANPAGAGQAAEGYRHWHKDWLHHDAKRLAEVYRQAPFELDWPKKQDGEFWAARPLETLQQYNLNDSV